MSQGLSDAFKTETTTFKYVDIAAEKDYLWDVAEKHLGDGLLRALECQQKCISSRNRESL